jgi:hypothetical protein
MPRCAAHRTNGEPCKAPAIAGGRVCRSHGGSCPQVVAAAKLRIALAADTVAARLVSIALNKKAKHSDAIAAARDLLDRAGIVRDRDAGAARADGTVLWDEFVAIYRRRVGAEDSARS